MAPARWLYEATDYIGLPFVSRILAIVYLIDLYFVVIKKGRKREKENQKSSGRPIVLRYTGSSVMPWVAACFELFATPLLGYCLAVRKLALQAGVLQEKKNDLPGQQTSNEETPLSADTTATTMVPNAEEQRQGKLGGC